MSASPRTLIIPLAGDELAVTVDGDDAVLDLGPAGRARGPGPDEPADEAADPPADEGRPMLHLRVPARALVAAVRVAWADGHDRGRFEPWRGRDRPVHGPSYARDAYARDAYARDAYARDAYARDVYGRSAYDRDFGYDAEYDRWADAFDDGYARYGHLDQRWNDDLGDGDPGGFRDPTVVPFPFRPAPPPARSGALWEPHEHRTLREMWFSAPPDADKNELVRDIAIRLERGVGGVSARLRVAGCDPTRPGSAWDGSWAEGDPEPGPAPGSAPTPVPLDGAAWGGSTWGGSGVAGSGVTGSGAQPQALGAVAEAGLGEDLGQRAGE